MPLPAPGLYDALYERHMSPAAWSPYSDAHQVLRTLRERGVGVGAVSDIGWDLRPVFRAHGLDAYALSYEHEVQKPDPRLFSVACRALGADPHETLMVGDSKEADGGAAALGCRVRFVAHLPVALRPDALLPFPAWCDPRGRAGGRAPAARGDPPRHPERSAARTRTWGPAR